MRSIGVRELKQHTSQVLRRVRAKRERIEVTYRGRAVARLIPVARPSRDSSGPGSSGPGRPPAQRRGSLWGGPAARLAAKLSLRGADAVCVAAALDLGVPLVSWDTEQPERGRRLVRVHTPGEAE